jgi:hypothetical protein
MAAFSVKFIKTVLNSTGHPFRAVQRVIIVDDASTPENALHSAQSDFERLEMIPNWRLHADCCEIENSAK